MQGKQTFGAGAAQPPKALEVPQKQGVRVSRRQDNMKGGQMMEEVLIHGVAAVVVSEL